MQRRTKKFVWQRAVANAKLAALFARPAAALLATPNVHLIKSVVPATPDTTLGSLVAVEADYTGYAAAAVPTTAGPVRESDEIQSLIVSVPFVAPNPLTVTATIVGYYVTDTTNAILYGCEMFDEPVPFTDPYDFLDLDLALTEDCAPEIPAA